MNFQTIESLLVGFSYVPIEDREETNAQIALYIREIVNTPESMAAFRRLCEEHDGIIEHRINRINHMLVRLLGEKLSLEEDNTLNRLIRDWISERSEDLQDWVAGRMKKELEGYTAISLIEASILIAKDRN